MQHNLLIVATFSAFSLLFAQLSFAEESSTFVARNVALQQHAQAKDADPRAGWLTG